MLRNIKRCKTEVKLTIGYFGIENIEYPRGFSFVKNNNYRLPPGYNEKVTSVLVPFPQGYGYYNSLGEGQALLDIYIDPGLSFWHQGQWKKLPHYFGSGNYVPVDGQKYLQQGWHWLCIHASHAWSREDNVLTLFKQAYLFLCDPFQRIK